MFEFILLFENFEVIEPLVAMPEVTRIGSRTLRALDVGADQEIVMPYVTAGDSTRLYYEEAGTGSPILVLHEFAADYASWVPQLRYFSRASRRA